MDETEHYPKMAFTPEHRRSRAGALFCVTTLALLAAGPAAAQDPVERGRYLATIMDCNGCHTPGALTGKPDMARYLGGAMAGFGVPGAGVFYPSNLTPDKETGLGSWSEKDIIKAVRTGERPDGRVLSPVMPYLSYAKMTDEDANALAAFLKSLPPVSHKVPGPTGPSEKAALPYFTLEVPK